MKDKKLILSLISTILAYASSILLGFLLTPILIASLGIEAFSFYPLTNNLVQFISVVIISISSTSSRHIKYSFSNGEESLHKVYFSSSFYLISFLSILVLLIFLPLIMNLQNVLNIPVELIKDVKNLFLLTIISLTIRFFSSSFGSIFYIEEKLYLRAISEILMNLVKIVSLVFMFLFFRANILFIGFSNLFMSLTLLIFNTYFYFLGRHKYPLSPNLIKISVIKKISISGFWNSISQVGMLLIYTSSITITNLTLGVEKSSYIPIFTFFPLFVQSFSSITSGVFLPSLISKFSSNNSIKIKKEVNFIFIINSFFLAPLLITFLYLSNSFFQLWTPIVLSGLFIHYSNITIIYTFFIVFFLPLTHILIVNDKLLIPGLVTIFIGFLSTISMFLFMKFTNLDLLSSPLILTISTLLYFLVFLPIFSLWKHKYLIKEIFSLFLINLIGLIISFNLLSISNLSENSSSSWISFLSSFIISYVICIFVLFLLLFTIFQTNKLIKKN